MIPTMHIVEQYHTKMCVHEVMQAAAACFERYYPAMLRRATKYVDCFEDAEDIVSECWIKLICIVPKLMRMDIQARSTYIMKTVQNEAIDFIRKRQRCTDSPLTEIRATTISSGSICPEQIVESHEFVRELLQFLPNQERKIISMYIQGYSTGEIAVRLKLTASSVRVYKHRAQQRLIDYVEAINKAKGN